MSRPKDADSKQKHASFKRAFETITSCREQKNMLAAYVVTFSVIEDRLRALYVVWYRSRNGGMDPSSKKIRDGFKRLVATLTREKVIQVELSNLLLEEAKRRNSLLHAAMWNLDGFTDQIADEVMKLARMIDKASRNATKQLTKASSAKSSCT